MVSELLVVLYGLWELGIYPYPINCPACFFSHPLIFPLGRNHHYDIVLLFYSKDMNRHIFNLITKYIHIPKILINEVSLNLISANKEQVVPPLLDESVSI